MYTECNNSFRCWECSVDCPIKQSFLLPEYLFIKMLHDSYAPNIGYMLAHSIPINEAEKIQNIKTMSIWVARKKYLEEQY